MEYQEVSEDEFTDEEKGRLNDLLGFARSHTSVANLGICKLRHIPTGEDHLILVGRDESDGTVYVFGRLFVTEPEMAEYEVNIAEGGEKNVEGG